MNGQTVGMRGGKGETHVRRIVHDRSTRIKIRYRDFGQLVKTVGGCSAIKVGLNNTQTGTGQGRLRVPMAKDRWKEVVVVAKCLRREWC